VSFDIERDWLTQDAFIGPNRAAKNHNLDRYRHCTGRSSSGDKVAPRTAGFLASAKKFAETICLGPFRFTDPLKLKLSAAARLPWIQTTALATPIRKLRYEASCTPARVPF